MIIRITVVFISLFIYINSVFAWDQYYAHKEFTKEAIYKSDLEKHLTESLGISEGIHKLYQEKRILDIISEGSEKEDKESRGLNHFYNPNKPAGENGLTLLRQ